MRYMMMIYLDEPGWEALPEAEQARVRAETTTYYLGLVESGHAESAARLCPATTATTLRERGGRLVLTDGPFTETKEVLAGYQILECKNLDEALAIGARFPGLRIGASVEVRPVSETGPDQHAPCG